MLRHQVDDPFATDRLNHVGDFRPEWDVPALGKTFTDAFSAAIDDVRADPDPDPDRKIHAFLGQAGYGNPPGSTGGQPVSQRRKAMVLGRSDRGRDRQAETLAAP